MFHDAQQQAECPVCSTKLKEPFVNCVECKPNVQLCLRVRTLVSPLFHKFNVRFGLLYFEEVMKKFEELINNQRNLS